MSKLNLINVIHWVSLGSAAVASAATVFSGDPKLSGYALGLISVSQVIHKFCDDLENKTTVQVAVEKAVTVKTL